MKNSTLDSLVESKFGLRENKDDTFFKEWRGDLPQLADDEKQGLDEIKKNFLFLMSNQITEELVKPIVLSPLLFMADFYSSSFNIREEVSVKITASNDGKLVRGRIDSLVIQNQLWIVVLESKLPGCSLNNVISQSLAYMLKTPTPELPAYGLATNGSEYRLIKLILQPTLQYGLSDLFSIQGQENQLYIIASFLKKIAGLIQS